MSLDEILALEGGAIHFSSLKRIAESPLHFRHALTERREPSRAMRIGTVVHHLVLGRQGARDLVTWPDRRAGKAWEAFRARHEAAGNEIVASAEWDEAEPMAAAVRAHEGAHEWLAAPGARFEVPIRWEMNGVPFASRGIDLVASGAIADLKTARSVNPRLFTREALRMHYHVQLAAYEDGARQNGIDTSAGVRAFAVENKPPHAVQVYRLTPALLDLGRRELALWVEQLKACAIANHWPAYSQAELDWDAPPESLEIELDDDDDDDAAPADAA